MATTLHSDRLRELIDVLVASLDDPAKGAELARRAYLSRFHFDRLVRAAVGEAPAAFRRRLLLERAAYELASGERTVTELAFDAGYRSPEAFARAFGRAFDATPTSFRQRRVRQFRLRAPSGVHFHPPAGVLVPGDDPRRRPMDLTDRMIEHDNWLTHRLIDVAAQLPEQALDAPVEVSPPTEAFRDSTPSIRAMLDRLVFTKEMWSAAIEGRKFVRDENVSIGGLRRRLDRAGERFVSIARDVRDQGTWDTAFVDTTCEPPESFTFGAAIAHALAWDSYRRQVAAAALRQHGVDDLSIDPIDWERRS